MELNKCAKCGGEAEHIKLWESKRPDCFFRCKGCGRETAVYTSKHNAVEAWNAGKLIHTDEDIKELLEQRAVVGRTMLARDKLLMLEAAARIERLAEDKAELEAIVDLRSKREWYSKFVEEVYQKIPGNELSTPDFDYIYEQYFKLAEELDDAKRDTIPKLRRSLERANAMGIEADKKIAELAEENEKWRTDWADNQKQWETAYDTQEEAVRTRTVEELREKFALHFGTYTENDTVRVLDVFKLLSQIE